MARRRLRGLIQRLRGQQLVDARGGPAPLIQTGNVAEKLVAAFGLKGRSIAPSLGDVVHPVAIVDDQANPSWWSQQIQRTCFVRIALGAIAGENGELALTIPAAVGVLARINWVCVDAFVAARFNYGYTTFLDSTVEVPFFADRRIPGIPAALIRSGTDAVDQVQNKLGVLHAAGNVQQTSPDLGVIIQPVQGGGFADNFIVQCELVNTACVLGLCWTEYQLP